MQIRKYFASDGVLSWNILSLRPDIVNSRVEKVLSVIYGFKASVFTLYLRFVCAILIMTINIPEIVFTAILILLITSLLMSYRNILGYDGSDQMNIIILIALSVHYAFESSFITNLAILFIASQSILSYTVAGIAKLLSEKWRNGSALFQIMNTNTYGNYQAAKWFRQNSVTVNSALAWSIIIFEVLFPLVIVLPFPYYYLFLITGFFFHLFNYFFMGLNNFFWTFLATYPSLVFLNEIIKIY